LGAALKASPELAAFLAASQAINADAAAQGLLQQIRVHQIELQWGQGDRSQYAATLRKLQAGLEAVKQLEPGKAGIFCLGGLPTQSQSVLDKTNAARRIITVDGCPLNCSRKIVEQAGYTPYKTINLVEDCGLKKGAPFTHTEQDLRAAVQAILDAVRSE